MFRKQTYANLISTIVRFRLALILALCFLASAAALVFGPPSKAMPATNPTYYFHGTPQDEANKALTFADATNRGTATWSTTAPTGTSDIVQKTSQGANADYAGNTLAAYWRNSYSGTINGNLQLNLYWSTPNAETTLLGEDVEISVFADPDYVADRVQLQHLIGRATVTLDTVGPTPTLFTGVVPVNGSVQNELLIQVVPVHSDTGVVLLVHYDSTATPSNFTIVNNATPMPTPTPTPTPTPSPTPTPDQCSTTTFSIHMSPAGKADDWGEPSIGVNWKTEKTFNGTPNGGTVMSYGGINVTSAMRVTFDDTNPAAPVATWEDAPLTLASITRVLGDPILFTDRDTGRTFVSQLLGGTKQSTTEFTDDDGRSFNASQGSGINSGVDHQTIGGGPLAPPLAGNPVTGAYKNGVWYCAQDVADANCALSIDGGRTFGPAVPIYTIADCSGLHGHLKVAQDGTVYIPNKGCGGSLPFHDNSKQSVVLSQDNGQTWQIRPVTTSTGNGTNTKSDPSLGIATDGTLYFG